MARYNRRDQIGHWVRKRDPVYRPCRHACCRGYHRTAAAPAWPGLALIPWCEAYVPVLGHLQPCRAPAIAAYRYHCALGHEVTRSVCADHDPVPGRVGCWHCKQEGREELMTWELVGLHPGPRE